MSFSPRVGELVLRWMLGACLAAPLAGQTGGSKPAPPVPEATPASSSEPASAPAHTLTAKETRDAQIAADTERLYELAQQLKVELDKSTKDTLSLTVVKKAAEIEKLAHSISERMKTN